MCSISFTVSEPKFMQLQNLDTALPFVSLGNDVYMMMILFCCNNLLYITVIKTIWNCYSRTTIKPPSSCPSTGHCLWPHKVQHCCKACCCTLNLALDISNKPMFLIAFVDMQSLIAYDDLFVFQFTDSWRTQLICQWQKVMYSKSQSVWILKEIHSTTQFLLQFLHFLSKSHALAVPILVVFAQPVSNECIGEPLYVRL